MGRRNRRKRRGGTWRPAQRRRKRAKQLASIAFCGIFGLLLGLWALYPTRTPEQPEDLANSWLPVCPVGRMPINFAHTLSTDDGPVFFCCEHCIEKFRTEPSRYAAEVAEERRRLAELPHVQVACPVSGHAAARDVPADDEGRRVFFCSDECRTRFLADPAAYRQRIPGTLWYQTRCPVTGDPIDPRESAVLTTGETVYFCSEACREKFLHDPAIWAASLAEQGLRLHL